MSKSVARQLYKAGAISEEDVALYEYAAYSFLFSLMPIALAFAIGALLGMVYEGLLMIIPFVFLRKFSGGYHLKSPAVCFFSSIALLSASLIGIKHVMRTGSLLVYSLFVVASVIIVFLLSPIDSEARRLSVNEQKTFKRISRLISSVFCLIYFVMVFLSAKSAAIPIGGGLLVTAALQLPCGLTRLCKSKRHGETKVE